MARVKKNDICLCSRCGLCRTENAYKRSKNHNFIPIFLLFPSISFSDSLDRVVGTAKAFSLIYVHLLGEFLLVLPHRCFLLHPREVVPFFVVVHSFHSFLDALSHCTWIDVLSQRDKTKIYDAAIGRMHEWLYGTPQKNPYIKSSCECAIRCAVGG